MQRLAVNTANQTAYFTLREGRSFYETSFSHFLIVLTQEDNGSASNELAQVLTVVEENSRYSEVVMTTVGLSVPTFYRYAIYGQNSDSNTDPNDSSVVGIVEQGLLSLESQNIQFTHGAITIESDTVTI